MKITLFDLTFFIPMLSLGSIFSQVLSPSTDLDIRWVSAQWFIILQFGQQGAPFPNLLNQELNFTWIPSHSGLTNNSSNVLGQEEITYKQKQCNSVNRIEILTLQSRDDSKWQVNDFYLKELDQNSGGEIGLAFLFTDKRYSLTHQLHKKQLINQLSYSISLHKAKVEEGALLKFGGVPLEVSSQYSTSCKVNSTFVEWNCLLSHVLFRYTNTTGNSKHFFQQNLPVFFNSKDSYIIAPLSFMKYLNDTILRKHIENGQCFMNSLPKHKSFKCKTAIIGLLPSEMVFVFDSHKVTLNMSSLLEVSNEMTFVNVFNFNDIDDHWVFGKHFLESYSLLFNYESEEITLYSPRKVFEYIDIDTIGNENELSSGMKIAIFLLVLGSLLALFVLIRKKLAKKKELNRIIKFTEVKRETKLL